MGKKVVSEAAITGMITCVAASAAEALAEEIRTGLQSDKEVVAKAVTDLSKLLDRSAQAILALCDELQPEVAKMNKARNSVDDIFKDFNL